MPVLQEEDADEVSRLFAEEEPRDRARLGLVGGGAGGAVTREEIEDGVGRGVVLRLRAARDLLARLGGDE